MFTENELFENKKLNIGLLIRKTIHNLNSALIDFINRYILFYTAIL